MRVRPLGGAAAILQTIASLVRSDAAAVLEANPQLVGGHARAVFGPVASLIAGHAAAVLQAIASLKRRSYGNRRRADQKHQCKSRSHNHDPSAHLPTSCQNGYDVR